MNTVYQFWIHTKSVGKLPACVEWLFNTPSHHRVHHDRRVHKNYAAIFIVWDRCAPPPRPNHVHPYSLTLLSCRMFGTFAPEGPPACSGARESVVYGCAHPVPTSNAVQVQQSRTRIILLFSLLSQRLPCMTQPHSPSLPLSPSDPTRTLRAPVLSNLAVWRTARFVAGPWLPPTSALPPPPPTSPLP